MSSRKRGSNSAARRKAAATCVAKQTVLWPRTNALVGALYNRYANEVQWPQGAPDSVKQNFAHVLAQALAPLHFSDREKTQPAIGDSSHAALQACLDSCHATQPRGVTRSLSGSGEHLPAKGTTSNSDAGCLQAQMTAQIKRMHDEIVALQRQVAILQAHLSDATGYIAVAVHPQLDASPAHSQCAWQGHPSETPRCIAKVI